MCIRDRYMGDVLNGGNAEILAPWYRICISIDRQDVYPKIEVFLGKVGRMKFLKPIYAALVSKGKRDYAISIFRQYQDFYNPMAVKEIKKILGIQDLSLIHI
eukprot:TRINITY_DN10482_c0_g1_i3.p1 TRINITY_DN10482_c0_g1~~TRINITY_DN10482_c0_g1_i3.p1  ORF type:complete len:102 (-),score=22.66 TRINITY_DN10482_c0_g1_i3:4-309(-)